MTNILAENMRRFNTKNLNEQTSSPRDLEKILVKNFYKFKFPTKLDKIENVWMPAFATVDNSFQDLGLDVEATKAEYTDWLQKNGFQPTDIYIDQQNIDSVQKQIFAKRFK